MVFLKNRLCPFGGIALAVLLIFTSQMLEGAWTTPIAISDSNSDQPSIAVDLSGNAVAVWQGFDGDNYVIQSSKLPYIGSWSQITTLSISGQDAQGCRVAVDSLGNAVSVWSRFDGYYSIIQGAKSSLNGSWSTPVNISESGANAEAPEIAMDYIGTVRNAVAVWHRYNESNFIVQSSQLASGGNWSTPDNLSASGQDSLIPEVFVDLYGNAVSIFSKYNGSVFSTSAVYQLQAQNWGSSYTLSTPSQPSNGPSVAMDSGGNAVAVWSEFNGTKYVVKSSKLPYGGSWSTPKILSNSSEDAFSPSVGMSADGTTVVAWIGFNGSNYIAQVSSSSFLGSWSTPDNLSSSGEDVSNIVLKINTLGHAVVVWDQTDGTDSSIYSASYTPTILGGSWSSAMKASSQGEFAYFPVVGVDSVGNAVAIWLQFDGIGYVVYGSTLAFL